MEGAAPELEEPRGRLDLRGELRTGPWVRGRSRGGLLPEPTCESAQVPVSSPMRKCVRAKTNW